MPSQTVSKAVEQRKAPGPVDLIKKYSTDFAAVLPSHVNAATWVRLAEGALKRGKRYQNDRDKNDPNNGKFELEVAAANNSGVFLASLLDAARLGLEPGTEQYYLTPRKVKQRLEILGIVGYQGHIELMYRAGAVSSIIADVVRANDEYRYLRGVDDIPQHRFKPFASDAERGGLIGVYAYARMLNGAVSKVIELSVDDIVRIKKSSQGSDSEYSPWVNHEVSMWLKSAVRQLQKWVPTSAEYRREQLRAAAEAQRVATAPGAPPGADTPLREYVDVEAEWTDEPPPVDDVQPPDGAGEGWPPVAQPGQGVS